jgi:ribosomal protein L7/L12
VADSVEDHVEGIERRLGVIESRLEQLFDHLNLRPLAAEAATGDDQQLDPNEDPEIQDLLAKGNEAQAIKRYHEITGLGLDDARRAIERAQSDG